MTESRHRVKNCLTCSWLNPLEDFKRLNLPLMRLRLPLDLSGNQAMPMHQV